jgi:hypothetical protein
MGLEASDLHVAYGHIEAVKGVSIRLDDGALVAVVGASPSASRMRVRTTSQGARRSGRANLMTPPVWPLIELAVCCGAGSPERSPMILRMTLRPTGTAASTS